jgi:hypothetical protein
MATRSKILEGTSAQIFKNFNFMYASYSIIMSGYISLKKNCL